MRIKHLAYLIGSIGMVAGSVAHADTGKGEEKVDRLERVTITGSNIKRIGSEKALAVDVIKKEEIKATGASTVVELLDKLPSVSSVITGTNSGSFAAGAASAGLRGMSSKYVLVLLNGRRMPNYAMFQSGTDSFVDLNTLPLSVIESVEILRDGASAIYGSDAVAGVINFKTKKNWQGANISARYGQTEDGDGMEQSASLSAGFGDLDKDGQNLLLSFDAYHREPVFSSKHDATYTADYRRFGGRDLRDSVLWGRWNDRTPNAAKTNLLHKPLPGCDPSRLVTTSNGGLICKSDNDLLGTQLAPRTTRTGLMANYTKRLGENSELFAELGFNRTLTPLVGTPSFIQTNIAAGWAVHPGNNPAYKALYPDYKPGDTLQITRYLSENGDRINEITSDTSRIVLGGRTVLKDWDLETSLNLGQNKVAADQNNVILAAPFMKMLQYGSVNGLPVYNPFLQTNTAASLQPYTTTTNNRSTNRLSAFEIKGSNGELFKLPAGSVGFAAGVQWSHEKVDSNPDIDLQQGNIMNFAVQQKLSASRSVASVFSELSVPVIKNLELQLALRGDHYNDFGNTVNPKVAFSYRPVEQFMLRGTATTGFKAPTLPQLYASRQAYTNLYDYDRCASQGIARSKCIAQSTQIQSGGNPRLKPEESTNLALGFVLQPTKDIVATVDFYDVRLKNTVQALSTQYVLDNASRFSGNIVRKPSDQPGVLGELQYVSAPYMNVGETKLSGVDIDVQYTVSLGDYGSLKFRDAHSRTFSYKESLTPTDPMVNHVDTYSQPRWRNSFTVGYSYQQYSAGFTARTVASTQNVYSKLYKADSAQPARIPSFTMLDVTFGYKPTKSVSISGGIKNLGNRIAPYSDGPGLGGFVGSSNDLWGRSFYLSTSYNF